MPVVVMPRLSDSMEEGTIVRWLVDDGTEVARGAELVEIETDKATMTYEAEDAGLLRIAAPEGTTLAVGALIATIGESGAAPADASAPMPAAAGAATPTGESASGNGRANRPKASPLARRLAAASGVDLAQMRGTGPLGRIVRRDVEAAVAAGVTLAATAVAAPVAARDGGPFGAHLEVSPPAAAATTAKGEIRVVEPTSVQRTIARRMAEAKATIPEFTLETDVDMEAAVALRAQLKSALPDGPIPSINDIVIKAAAWALRRHPKANGAFRDGAFELHERINVGVAVAADDALLVPTIFDADRASLTAIAQQTRALAEKAREGKLTPSELAGGTFTVSNLGMYGVQRFTAVINPPQAAILAVGSLEQRPVVRDEAIVAGQRMTITLTSDHRILYGADAAAFLADVRGALEAPLRLI